MPPTRTTQDKWMKFEPSVNTGQIIQIAAILVSVTLAYGKLSANDDAQAKETENVKILAAADSQRTKESLTDLRIELKDQTRAINEIKESVAILRGRAAEVSGSGVKR